jgi:hypothetical protein
MSFRSGFLAGRKTYVLAALGALSALGGWATGQVTDEQLLRALFESAVAATLRHGIAACAEEPEERACAAKPLRLPRLEEPPRGER